METQPHRFNNFDFLRFMLAMMVIFSHSFDMLNGRESNPFHQFSGGQAELGSMAVYGFFIISGYLITQSFLNSRSLWDYFRRRVLRIYPGYIVAGFISLLLFAPLGMSFAREYWDRLNLKVFVFRLIFLQEYWIPETFQTNHWPYVNVPIWTIQHEFVCYILLALLGLAGILRRRGLVLALFVPLYLFYLAHMPLKLWINDWQEVAWFPLTGTMWFTAGGKPDYYPRFWTFFLAGTLAFLYRDRLSYRPPVAAGLAVITLAAAAYGHRPEPFPDLGALGAMEFTVICIRSVLLDAILPFALTYILFTIAFMTDLPFQRWAKHGDFSYGLYLYGWPVQQSVIFLCIGWIAPWSLFLISSLVTMLFAYASWRLVERPFLKMKQRRDDSVKETNRKGRLGR